MAIILPNLYELDSTYVDQAHAYITQRVLEYAPNVETKRGVLHDILFHLEAVLQAAQDTYADKLRRSNSLLTASADPELATDEIINQIASNFRTSRFAGTASTGKVVIVIDSFVPSSVSQAVTFSASGQTFRTTGLFVGRTNNSQVVGANDRLIKPLGDGTYYYVVNMTSAGVGTAANIGRNTKLTPDIAIANFVTAYSESSFAGGSNYESNADFIKRLQEGISSKNLSNRVTISSMIRDQTAFKSVLDVSTVGYGDAEQQRYHSVFPIASGNRLDIYVRPQTVPTVKKVDKTAVLIGRDNGGGLWQVSIDKSDMPGFYDVDKVIKADVVDSDSQTGLEVVSDTRGYDLTNEAVSFIPDITSYVEAAYTGYQTAVIRFVDTTTDPALEAGVTQDYSLFLRGMGLIRDIQDFVGGRDVRPAGGDVIVKAAIPCDLKLSFVIFKKNTDSDVDLVSLKEALADKVNRSGFSGRLVASTLQAVIHSFLTGTQAVSSVEMFGAIRRPDGTIKYIRDFDVLEIPSESAKMVSNKTTVFVLDPKNIGASVKIVDSSGV
jgi:hypothetical protein